MQRDGPWTDLKVGYALVRAYQLLDGAPVMRDSRGFTVDGERIGPRSLEVWIGMRRYVREPRDLTILRVWASCTAKRESVRGRFEGLGWHPKTADRRRRAALAAIARGLNDGRDTPDVTSP